MLPSFPNMPTRDDVAMHVCAFLNGCVGGRVCIGVAPDTGLIHGKRFSRKDKDLFNQGMDTLLGGRFIQPRVLSDFLEVDFRELADSRPTTDNPYYVRSFKLFCS